MVLSFKYCHPPRTLPGPRRFKIIFQSKNILGTCKEEDVSLPQQYSQSSSVPQGLQPGLALRAVMDDVVHTPNSLSYKYLLLTCYMVSLRAMFCPVYVPCMGTVGKRSCLECIIWLRKQTLKRNSEDCERKITDMIGTQNGGLNQVWGWKKASKRCSILLPVSLDNPHKERVHRGQRDRMCAKAKRRESDRFKETQYSHAWAWIRFIFFTKTEMTKAEFVVSMSPHSLMLGPLTWEVYKKPAVNVPLWTC